MTADNASNRSPESRRKDATESPTEPIVNALTIDLEDWPQSVLDPRLPITSCVVENTERILALLRRFDLRATFFALGKVCEKHPQLLPRIAAEGHEIATHGYGHEVLYRLSPERFRDDLRRSLDLIGEQTGRRPIGYRAPQFSVTRRSLWAGPVMAELGIRYSSSIFPIAGRRYGIPEARRHPHRWPTCDLIEFPLTTWRRFGRNLPVAGGGYLRLLPVRIVASAVREANREGHPAAIYVHPYELAVDEIRRLRREGWRIGWKTRLMQSLFRSRIEKRLTRLFREFAFAPMGEVLGLSR
ncbi:MAG: DUF3473 domain-containing protein, partial [Planctomycetota bacterium]